MALRIVQLEEIQGLMLEVPKIVRLYEEKSFNFLGAVHQWLKQLETVLENNRLHIVGRVAALRGTIISSERGGKPKSANQRGSYSRKKSVESAAVNVLREVCEIMEEAISSRVDQFAEAEKVTRQMVAIAAVKGILDHCKSLPSHQQVLGCIQSAIASDKDLAGYYVMVNGLVGTHDTTVLIDRALPMVSS